MADPVISVIFKAVTSELKSGLKDAEAGTQTFGKSMSKMGKAAVVAGGAAGFGLLVGVMKTGIDEFSEASKVAAQTDAAIKSTGEAAHVTSGHVADLAGALMKKSGVDDEAIQSGENLLLTFTKIQNQAGKGNKIFDQATRTMLDMSVALGQDTTQSAVQLGKALNDPIKGVTALRKVGVTFTQAQQDQIKAMVESGDTMGAQKLILAELNREFGGSAAAIGKTLPGQVAVLKQSFSNLAGELVGTLAPAFQTVATFLAEHPALFKAIVIAVLALAAALVVLNVALAISAAITAGIAAPILIGIAAFVALIAIIVLVVRHWDTIRDAVTGAIDAIVNAAQQVKGAVVGAFTTAFDAVKTAAETAFNWIKDNWPLLVGILLAPVTGGMSLVVAAIVTHWETIKNATTTAWNAIKTTVTGVVDGIKTAITTAFNAAKSVVTTAVNATQTAVDTAFNAIKTVVTSVVGAVKTAAGKIADAFNEPAKAAATMLSAIKTAFNAIDNAISAVVGAVSRAAGKVADAITAPIEGAKKIVNAVIGRFNALSIPGFTITIPIPHAPDIHFGWGGMDLPDIPMLAKGGIVSKPTLAMIGEGTGREIVAPESLLRSIMEAAQSPVFVSVFIGDTELRGLVQSEITSDNSRVARRLLAGNA